MPVGTSFLNKIGNKVSYSSRCKPMKKISQFPINLEINDISSSNRKSKGSLNSEAMQQSYRSRN